MKQAVTKKTLGKMKKPLSYLLAKPITTAILLVFMFSSCTVYKASKTPQGLPVAPLERNEYVITDDLTAEAKMTVVLGFLHFPKRKWGSIVERRYYAGIPVDKLDKAESLVIYQLITENPDLDYIVSPRFERKVSKAVVVQTTTIKVRAKGIKIKTDSSRSGDKK